MSGFTVTTTFVYTLVSNLRENGSMRYVSTVTDGASNKYFATIFDVSGYPVAEGVKYVLSISPIAPNSSTLASQIVFYQVYVNPYTTELITTPISNAIPISFSISKSLIYLFYMNQSFGLQFMCPYTNISGCKQSILNIFSYPNYIVMLYGSFFLQFSYIQTAYEAAITGSYDGSSMMVHNLFDFNSTFVILEKSQPQLYWNSERFSVANQVPYISYSTTNTTSLVVGFTNTYIIQQNDMTSPDLMSNVSQSSLNIPSNTAGAVGYTSLGSLVPLTPTTPTDGFTYYYLSGVAGIGFSGSQYATIQIVNILNSNNVYESISALIVEQASQTTPVELTRYGTTSLWYNLNLTTNTLTVWEDSTALITAFSSFVSSNSTTIMTSDMVQLTTEQINSFYSGFMGDQRMGGFVDAAKAAIDNFTNSGQGGILSGGAISGARVAGAVNAAAEKLFNYDLENVVGGGGTLKQEPIPYSMPRSGGVVSYGNVPMYKAPPPSKSTPQSKFTPARTNIPTQQQKNSDAAFRNLRPRR